MSLKTAYEFQAENDVDFTSGTGWIAIIAFAFALAFFVASFYFQAF